MHFYTSNQIIVCILSTNLRPKSFIDCKFNLKFIRTPEKARKNPKGMLGKDHTDEDQSHDYYGQRVLMSEKQIKHPGTDRIKILGANSPAALIKM